MEVSDAVERISGKMEARGIAVDRSKVESKIRRLVEEFGVHLAEAERTVLHELAREHSLPAPGGRAQEREIQGLAPGEWVTVQGKVVALTSPLSPAIAQAGVLADSSGAIRFTVWARAKAQPLAPGSVYSIYYALVDEFNGRLQLNLSTAMYLPEEGDIRVTEGEVARGVIVHIAPGSGLIKRCPVEGCNRVLSRQNYCPVHEIQKDFRYDLRIKGVLDDGIRTRNLLIQKDLVEILSGMELEEAIALAESNPLGMDEVYYRIRDAVLGRYFQVRGSEIDGRILVKECGRVAFDPADLAALLNRAGGEAR